MPERLSWAGSIIIFDIIGKPAHWVQKRRLRWAQDTLEALKTKTVMRSVFGEVQVIQLIKRGEDQ